MRMIMRIPLLMFGGLRSAEHFRDAPPRVALANKPSPLVVCDMMPNCASRGLSTIVLLGLITFADISSWVFDFLGPASRIMSLAGLAPEQRATAREGAAKNFGHVRA